MGQDGAGKGGSLLRPAEECRPADNSHPPTSRSHLSRHPSERCRTGRLRPKSDRGHTSPVSKWWHRRFSRLSPRDDQAASLGYETRNWFEVLTALGAYPPTGRFAHVNDNTEYLSRTTPYLCCRFPNGAIAIARHFRHTPELWQGGFARDPKADQAYLQKHPLSPSRLQLKDFHVHGHTLTYEGDLAVTFRVDERHHLIAFAGRNTDRIQVDGTTTVFADKPMPLVSWAPVPPECRLPHGAILRIFASGEGTIRIPLNQPLREVQLFAEGPQPGSRGDALPAHIEQGVLVFTLTSAYSGRWLYAVP